jgi:hypothetical protein
VRNSALRRREEERPSLLAVILPLSNHLQFPEGMP